MFLRLLKPIWASLAPPSRTSPTDPLSKDVPPVYAAPVAVCFYVPYERSLDTIEAESLADCKHCAARKEAIVRLLPDMVPELASAPKITWRNHDITDVAHSADIELVCSPESGYAHTLELFFLEDSK